MDKKNLPQCNTTGVMADQEIHKMMSLAYTGSIISWDARIIRCILPAHHEEEHHVSREVSQYLGDEVEVNWWASWKDGHKAYLFTAPVCQIPDRNDEKSCGQLVGHYHSCISMDDEVYW